MVYYIFRRRRYWIIFKKPILKIIPQEWTIYDDLKIEFALLMNKYAPLKCLIGLK